MHYFTVTALNWRLLHRVLSPNICLHALCTKLKGAFNSSSKFLCWRNIDRNLLSARHYLFCIYANTLSASHRTKPTGQ